MCIVCSLLCCYTRRVYTRFVCMRVYLYGSGIVNIPEQISIAYIRVRRNWMENYLICRNSYANELSICVDIGLGEKNHGCVTPLNVTFSRLLSATCRVFEPRVRSIAKTCTLVPKLYITLSIAFSFRNYIHPFFFCSSWTKSSEVKSRITKTSKEQKNARFENGKGSAHTNTFEKATYTVDRRRLTLPWSERCRDESSGALWRLRGDVFERWVFWECSMYTTKDSALLKGSREKKNWIRQQ